MSPRNALLCSTAVPAPSVSVSVSAASHALERSDQSLASVQPELLDIVAVCAFFGGSRPLDRATIYRGVVEGRYPRPIKIGKNSNRWLRSECAAALAAIIAEPRLTRAYRGQRNRLRRDRRAGQGPA
jgi:predicted DNA-binding transcriptional regulator AlpA